MANMSKPPQHVIDLLNYVDDDEIDTLKPLERLQKTIEDWKTSEVVKDIPELKKISCMVHLDLLHQAFQLFDIFKGKHMPIWMHEDIEAILIERMGANKTIGKGRGAKELRAYADFLAQYWRWIAVMRHRANGYTVTESLGKALEDLQFSPMAKINQAAIFKSYKVFNPIVNRVFEKTGNLRLFRTLPECQESLGKKRSQLLGIYWPPEFDVLLKSTHDNYFGKTI